jgi:hypothetical protein
MMDKSQLIDAQERVNFTIAFAQELQQYMNENPQQFEDNTWDNLCFWLSRIVPQGMIIEDSFAELLNYLDQGKIQELIKLAIPKAKMETNFTNS